MTSVPIYEAKNKLPHFIHMVEMGESFEITRHGNPVAYLVNKPNLENQPKVDKFELVLNHWKEKYSDSFLTEDEEKDYFEKPRQKSNLRNLEDF